MKKLLTYLSGCTANFALRNLALSGFRDQESWLSLGAIRDVQIPVGKAISWQEDMSRKVMGSVPVPEKDFPFEMSVKVNFYSHLVAEAYE